MQAKLPSLAAVLAGGAGLYLGGGTEGLAGRQEGTQRWQSSVVGTALCIRASAECTVLRHKFYIVPADVHIWLF